MGFLPSDFIVSDQIAYRKNKTDHYCQPARNCKYSVPTKAKRSSVSKGKNQENKVCKGGQYSQTREKCL